MKPELFIIVETHYKNNVFVVDDENKATKYYTSFEDALSDLRDNYQNGFIVDLVRGIIHWLKDIVSYVYVLDAVKVSILEIEIPRYVKAVEIETWLYDNSDSLGISPDNIQYMCSNKKLDTKEIKIV